MTIKKRIEEIMMEGAEALDPAESDPRAVGAEQHAPPPVHHTKPPRVIEPESAEVRPSAKELGKEHRGY